MLCIINIFRRLRVVCLPAMACWRCQTTPLTISANHEGRPARGVAKKFPIDFRNVIASGRSNNVFFDIVEFVGRDTIEEEVVAGTVDGKQIVVKSGSKPKLESVTLSQWSIANLATIMYTLMGEGRLVGQGVVDYLSYTTKIYQLTQRYENASVYFYDREYRKLQAAHNFRWGTDIPHLHTMQLIPRLSRNNRQSQVSQLKQNQRVGPLTADGKAICKMYNTVRGCG